MGLLLLFLLGFQFCQFIDTNSKLKCSHEDQIKVQRTMIPFVKKKRVKRSLKHWQSQLQNHHWLHVAAFPMGKNKNMQLLVIISNQV